MHDFFFDVRYSCRLLLRNPGFAAVAIAALGLGIGANTAIFTAVDAVLLRPLPYLDADRLVMVWEDASHQSFPRNNPAPANYFDWRKQNTVFSEMAAMRFRNANLTGDGQVARMFVAQGLSLTGAGFVVGVIVSLLVGRLMRAMLYEVAPADVRTYLAVTALIGAVASMACYIPARRAARVDPIEALREE